MRGKVYAEGGSQNYFSKTWKTGCLRTPLLVCG